MKRGFTILELLVASLLLGMLVTILTQIFNQSSIAWRTGVAGVAHMDEVRDNIAEVREEADNIFVHGTKTYRIAGLWDKDGELRNRAYASSNDDAYKLVILDSTKVNASTKGTDIGTVDVGKGGTGNTPTYTVGVTSWGPDREPETYDDITTWPDVIE